VLCLSARTNSTPISAVVAANGGWHLSHEMCVTYAMVMSITGDSSADIAYAACNKVIFVCFINNRDSVDHDFVRLGPMAVHPGRI